MSGTRDKLWYILNDGAGEVAALELRQDVLDALIADERQL